MIRIDVDTVIPEYMRKISEMEIISLTPKKSLIFWLFLKSKISSIGNQTFLYIGLGIRFKI